MSPGRNLYTSVTLSHTTVGICLSSVPLLSSLQRSCSMIRSMGVGNMVAFFGHMFASSSQACLNVASQAASGTNLNFSDILEHTSPGRFCSSALLSSASHTMSSMIFARGSGNGGCFEHLSSKCCQAIFTASWQIGIGMASTLEHTLSTTASSTVASSSSLQMKSLMAGGIPMLAPAPDVLGHFSSKSCQAVLSSSSQTGVGMAVTLEHASSTAAASTETSSSSLHSNRVMASGKGKLPCSFSAALATTAAQAARTRTNLDSAMITRR
mmetsp:Transcript_67017/g.187131  ORF Transcript_67017/g.187131 Transcript_67017/m.187131 type:complete len:268 (-) Transcript_67017:46-849(-)